MKFMTKISAVPIRAEPSHRAEMVSQLLYGELVEIMEEQTEWVKVKCVHDEYVGWADSRSFHETDELPKYIVVSRTLKVQLDGFDTRLPFGSLINTQEIDDGMVTEVLDSSANHPNNLLQVYLKEWMGAPYLWGGRSTFGTDCSGLVQVIFGALGIKLPRDASQQIMKGEVVQFHEKKQGDLAFFESPSGSITHVGIVMDHESIVHASAWVRKQKLTSDGIINESGSVTHILAGIRRYK